MSWEYKQRKEQQRFEGKEGQKLMDTMIRDYKKNKQGLSTKNKKDEKSLLYYQLKGGKKKKKNKNYFPLNLKPDLLCSTTLNNHESGQTSFGVDADNLFFDASFTGLFQEKLYKEFQRLFQKYMKISDPSQLQKYMKYNWDQYKRDQEKLMNYLLLSLHSEVVKAIQAFFVRLKPLLKMIRSFNTIENTRVRMFVVFDGDRLPKKSEIQKDKQKYSNPEKSQKKKDKYKSSNKQELKLMNQKDKIYTRLKNRIRNQMIMKIMELIECLDYSLQREFQRKVQQQTQQQVQRQIYQQGYQKVYQSDDIDVPTSPCFIQIVVAPYGADQQLIWLWQKRKIDYIFSKDYGYCHYNIPIVTEMYSIKGKRDNPEQDIFSVIKISKASKFTFRNKDCKKATDKWIDKTYVKDDPLKRLFFLALRGSSYSLRFSKKSLDLNQPSLTNNIFNTQTLMLLVTQSQYQASNKFDKQVQQLVISFWKNADKYTNGLLPWKMASKFLPNILDAMKIFFFHTIRSFPEAILAPLNFSPLVKNQSYSTLRLLFEAHESEKIKHYNKQQFQNWRDQFGGMKPWQLKKQCQRRKIEEYLQDKSEQQKKSIKQNIRIAQLVGEYGYDCTDYYKQKKYQNGQIYRNRYRGQNRFLRNLKELEDIWQQLPVLFQELELQYWDYEGPFSKMLDILFERQQEGNESFYNFYQSLNDNRQVLLPNYKAKIYDYDSWEEKSESEESQEQDEQDY